MAPSTKRGARQQPRSPRVDETQKDQRMLPEWAFMNNEDSSGCRERSGTEESGIFSCEDKSNREDETKETSPLPVKIAPLRSESLQLRRSSEADKDTKSHHQRRSSRNRRSSLQIPSSATSAVARSMASSLRRSSVVSSEDSTSSRRGSEYSLESFSHSDNQEDNRDARLYAENEPLGSCAASDHSQEPMETPSESRRQRSRPSFQKSRLYTNRTLRAETEKRMQQFNLAKSSEPHRNQTVPVTVNPPPNEEPAPRRRKSFTQLVTGRESLLGNRNNSQRSLQSRTDKRSDSRPVQPRRMSLTPLRNRERRPSIDPVNASLAGFMDKEKTRRPSFSFISAAFGKNDDVQDDDHSNIAPFADNSEEGNYSTCSAPVVAAKPRLASTSNIVPTVSDKSMHGKNIQRSSSHIEDELAEIEMAHRNGQRSYHSRSNHSRSYTSRDDSNSLSDDSLDDSVSGP